MISEETMRKINATIDRYARLLRVADIVGRSAAALCLASWFVMMLVLIWMWAEAQ